jgi:hypothetical protein
MTAEHRKHPADNNWQETKREYEISESGEYVPKHITMEPGKSKILGFEKKDFWDQIIKSIGIVAIVTPLILFKCSRDANIEEQKSIMQIDLFSNVLSDIQRIILLPDTSTEFKSSRHRLDIEHYSKMMMLGDNSIGSLYKNLRDTINLYCLFAESNHTLDTIRKHFNVIRIFSSVADKHTQFQKDSAIKKRAALLEKSAMQWVASYNLINSVNKDRHLRYRWMDGILYNLNLIEPSIQQQIISDTLKNINFKTIDSLATGFYRETTQDKNAARKHEEHFIEVIQTYYDTMNRMMRKINKVLARNGG